MCNVILQVVGWFYLTILLWALWALGSLVYKIFKMGCYDE